MKLAYLGKGAELLVANQILCRPLVATEPFLISNLSLPYLRKCPLQAGKCRSSNS